MDSIRIDGLELRCIVGLRSYERRHEQPLRLDLHLGLDASTAGRSGRIGDTIDYSRVADEVTALLQFREYRLLEVLCEEAAAFLFASHPRVQQVTLRVDKPEALRGRARTAAVQITRSRGAFGATEEATPYGGKIVLLREAEATVELLRLEPGQDLRLADPVPRLEMPFRAGEAKAVPAVFAAASESSYAAQDSTLWVARCLVLLPQEADDR
jgi:7,8-dihydroneopterin aldolase/epimerase/oxygenase